MKKVMRGFIIIQRFAMMSTYVNGPCWKFDALPLILINGNVSNFQQGPFHHDHDDDDDHHHHHEL